MSHKKDIFAIHNGLKCQDLELNLTKLLIKKCITVVEKTIVKESLNLALNLVNKTA